MPEAACSHPRDARFFGGFLKFHERFTEKTLYIRAVLRYNK